MFRRTNPCAAAQQYLLVHCILPSSPSLEICNCHPPPPPFPCCSIEAALAGHSFVPAWDRMQHEEGQPGQPLVLAEALQYDSGTEGGCWGG